MWNATRLGCLFTASDWSIWRSNRENIRRRIVASPDYYAAELLLLLLQEPNCHVTMRCVDELSYCRTDCHHWVNDSAYITALSTGAR